jgi:hypothetical protein
MQLSDVQGAFLEAGPIPQQYRPLYAWLPPGGLPGAEGYELAEVMGDVYGQNDAPAAWYRVLDHEVCQAGFERSLYFMRDRSGSLIGVLGFHVDDTVTGGSGPDYEYALQRLQTRFPYRKWCTHQGDFCGAHDKQSPDDFFITMTQKVFSDKIRPAHLSVSRRSNRAAPLDKKEISVLRAINGSLH